MHARDVCSGSRCCAQLLRVCCTRWSHMHRQPMCSTAMMPMSPVFRAVPRIRLGGWMAVFAGHIANNVTLAKLKVFMKGRALWVRTISSTIVGQLCNTVVFYVVALGGIIPGSNLLEAIVAGWVCKTIVEVVLTPITYVVIGWLKRVEGEDYYDTDTNFNPFSLRVPGKNG